MLMANFFFFKHKGISFWGIWEEGSMMLEGADRSVTAGSDADQSLTVPKYSY